MLELHFNNVSSESIVVTLNELVTISNPFYLFIFTNIETNATVSIILSSLNDISTHQYRYNEFLLDTKVLFVGKTDGLWNYEVYQQSSNINTDPTLSAGVIEKGKLRLFPATEFAFKEYSTTTSYKVYNG